MELASSLRHLEGTDRCLHCDVIAAETRTGSRVVGSRGGVVALAPFASRVPFELMLAPAAHEARFEHAHDDVVRGCAELLGRMLRRLRVALEDPAYTLVLHSAPRGTSPEAFHWHLEVIPRLVPLAGFEWGTGAYINPTRPEEAAAAMRALADVD